MEKQGYNYSLSVALHLGKPFFYTNKQDPEKRNRNGHASIDAKNFACIGGVFSD